MSDPRTSWQKVVFASDLSDCPCCEEDKWCPIHEMHFSDCECIGPTEEDVEYKEEETILYGRRV